jgi:hypothetical protein
MAFHQPKILKSESADKGPFTNHLYHDTLSPIDYHNKEFLMFTSIDPGIKRFAMRIEKRYANSRLPIITELQIATTFSDFVTGANGESSLYNEVTKFLDTHFNLINQCDFIIIERQMEFNYQMVRLSQHMVTYFQFRLKNNYMRTRIIEQDSKIKTKALGAPAGMGKKQLKEWAYFVATQLIEQRRDEACMQFFNKMKRKLDKYDPADTIVQLEAFCVHHKFRKTDIVIKHPSFEKFYDLSSEKKVSADYYNQSVYQDSPTNYWDNLVPNRDFQTFSDEKKSLIHSPKPVHGFDIGGIDQNYATFDISPQFSFSKEPESVSQPSFSFSGASAPISAPVPSSFNPQPSFTTPAPLPASVPSSFNPQPSFTTPAPLPASVSSSFNSQSSFTTPDISTLNNSQPSFSYSQSADSISKSIPINGTYPPPASLPIFSMNTNTDSFNRRDISPPSVPDFSFEYNNLEPNYSEKRSPSRGGSGGLFKFKPGIVDKTKPADIKNISPPKNPLSSSSNILQRSGIFDTETKIDRSNFLHLESIIPKQDASQPVFSFG